MNPNQIKMTRMPVSDDLFYDNQKLSISQKEVFIPFKTDGTTVYFNSRAPTQREIIECTRIIITGETEWDTQSVRMVLVQTNEEEESHEIFDISQATKVRNLETDRIIGGIGDVFMERATT